jgi:acyl-CoA synthetase (NDP forming)
LAVAANPLDMIATAGPDQYRQAIAAVLAAEEVDALLVLYTPVDPGTAWPIVDAIREGIVDGRANGGTGKPILACLMADENHARLLAGAEQIPVYPFPENAARALGKAVRYAAWRELPASDRRPLGDLDPKGVSRLCRAVVGARGADWLTAEESARVLAGYGISVTPSVPVRSAVCASMTAKAMGFPVVAKLNSTHGLHKTDVGGVEVNLTSSADVEAAFERLTTRAAAHSIILESVSIQPMIVGAVETAIGITRDSTFGSLVGFGLGGVDIEALQDMHFRVTPMDDRDVAELLTESRASRLLSAHRGRPAGDLAALAELLTRVSRLAEDVPEVIELDLNPVLVLPAGRGCHVVDVRIRVGPSAQPTPQAG